MSQIKSKGLTLASETDAVLETASVCPDSESASHLPELMLAQTKGRLSIEQHFLAEKKINDH